MEKLVRTEGIRRAITTSWPTQRDAAISRCIVKPILSRSLKVRGCRVFLLSLHNTPVYYIAVQSIFAKQLVPFFSLFIVSQIYVPSFAILLNRIRFSSFFNTMYFDILLLIALYTKY